MCFQNGFHLQLNEMHHNLLFYRHLSTSAIFKSPGLDSPQEFLGQNLRKHKFELSNSFKIQKFRFFDTNFLGQNLAKLTFKSCRDALQDAGIDFETAARENTN